MVRGVSARIVSLLIRLYPRNEKAVKYGRLFYFIFSYVAHELVKFSRRDILVCPSPLVVQGVFIVVPIFQGPCCPQCSSVNHLLEFLVSQAV